MKIIFTVFISICCLTTIAQTSVVNKDSNNHEYEYFGNGKVKADYLYQNDSLLNATFYWQNGLVQLSVIYEYTKEFTIIKTKQYTKQGVLMSEETTIDGVKDGYNNVYFKSGQIRIKATDQNGIRLSETIYRKDGSIKQNCNCNANTKKCTLDKFSKNGAKKKTIETNFKGYGIVIYK